ncbi:MAG: response regulator [Cyanobacteria bacterium J06639_14]
MFSADNPNFQIPSDSNQSRILIVDDNPTNLKVLSESICGQGWITLVAEDGETALEQFDYACPDLILLDVMMPGIDGFETCRRIKADPGKSSIPIIFMTALSDTVDKVKGLELGAVDYITKPFQQEEVIARVRLHLRLSQLTKALGQRNHELNMLNQTLEERVTARTQELTSSIKILKETQLQLIQSEKMSALGQLVAGIGHEISNPICFINGNIECVHTYVADLLGLLDLYQAELSKPSSKLTKFARKIDLDYLIEDLPKLIVSMRQGADRIAEISSSLRVLARGDQTSKSEAQLHESLDSALLLLQHRLKANEWRPAILIEKEYGDLPLIQCYPGQLNQVFMNILANAVDAFDESNQGHSYDDILAAPNKITLTTRHEADWILIVICDNGPGMDETVKDQVFDHLFTTKPIGKGTGLGLSISQQIVTDNHGGTLMCTSRKEEGTTFTIKLPA